MAAHSRDYQHNEETGAWMRISTHLVLASSREYLGLVRGALPLSSPLGPRLFGSAPCQNSPALHPSDGSEKRFSGGLLFSLVCERAGGSVQFGGDLRQIQAQHSTC